MHKRGAKPKMKLKGRIVSKGTAEGKALVSKQAISFYGSIDLETGKVIEKDHELYGKNIAGKILVFPTGKGSTVGSYALYRLKKQGKAPAGIINKETEAIIATGAIISEIPLIDKIDCSKIRTGDRVKIDCIKGWVEK